MPDLKQATDHLAPLDLSHQFAYYYGGREGCYGLEVTSYFLQSFDFDLTSIPRIPLRLLLFVPSVPVSGSGYLPTFPSNGVKISSESNMMMMEYHCISKTARLPVVILR